MAYEKGALWGIVFLMHYGQHFHGSHFLVFCKLVHLQNILDQLRSLTFNTFGLNMVKGHHPQPRYHSPLFHNLTWFNIKAAMIYHSIIQKEVDELVAKCSIDP